MSLDEQAIGDHFSRWRRAAQANDVQAMLDMIADDARFLVAGREPFGRTSSRACRAACNRESSTSNRRSAISPCKATSPGRGASSPWRSPRRRARTPRSATAIPSRCSAATVTGSGGCCAMRICSCASTPERAAARLSRANGCKQQIRFKLRLRARQLAASYSVTQPITNTSASAMRRNTACDM